jgi:hypothetical protein
MIDVITNTSITNRYEKRSRRESHYDVTLEQCIVLDTFGDSQTMTVLYFLSIPPRQRLNMLFHARTARQCFQ